jgi:hypothetical protein
MVYRARVSHLESRRRRWWTRARGTRRADGATRAQAGAWSGSSEGDGGTGVGGERSQKNKRREEARCCPFLGQLLCCAVLCGDWRRSKEVSCCASIVLVCYVGIGEEPRGKLLCCRLLLELEVREERSKGLLPGDLPFVGTEWDKAQLCFRWTSPNCALGELWGIGLVCCGFRLSRI